MLRSMTVSLFASFANAFCEALSFKLMEILVSALHPPKSKSCGCSFMSTRWSTSCTDHWVLIDVGHTYWYIYISIREHGAWISETVDWKKLVQTQRLGNYNSIVAKDSKIKQINFYKTKISRKSVLQFYQLFWSWILIPTPKMHFYSLKSPQLFAKILPSTEELPVLWPRPAGISGRPLWGSNPPDCPAIQHLCC